MQKKSEYIKVASYEGKKGQVKKVVLLYSGGLDTSVMLKWIQDEYKAQVIALTIDIGQMADDLQAIKANANYQHEYRLATPLGRPLLAKWAVKIAALERADCIAHGCTGKGND